MPTLLSLKPPHSGAAPSLSQLQPRWWAWPLTSLWGTTVERRERVQQWCWYILHDYLFTFTIMSAAQLLSKSLFWFWESSSPHFFSHWLCIKSSLISFKQQTGHGRETKAGCFEAGKQRKGEVVTLFCCRSAQQQEFKILSSLVVRSTGFICVNKSPGWSHQIKW